MGKILSLLVGAIVAILGLILMIAWWYELLFVVRGVIPPMITPFKEDGEIDYDSHISNLKKWNDDNLAGYLVLRSNSETPYLNEKEKLDLIRCRVK